MRNLKELFENVDYEIVAGDMNKEVTDLIIDSRKAVKGCAFFCFVGAKVDAHKYAADVAKKKPAAIVIQNDIETDESFEGITIIKTKDTRYALGQASAAFFDYPAKKLLMVGITGTKGKTSLTYIMQSILDHSGLKCGTIGTVGVNIDGKLYETKTTTPESYEIEYYLNRMVEAGCKACVMEVSSQALMLNRVAGIVYDYGIFTNLTIDHIGEAEHKDFADYVYCKSLLFKQCRHGIFNKDDEQYGEMTKHCTCDIHTFSAETEAELMGCNFEYVREGEFIGITFDTKGLVNESFKVSAPGRFSMYNAMPAIMLAALNNIPMDTVKEALMNVHVKGRMEPVKISKKFHLLIDYAHNAVSTESILRAMREYKPKRIVSLFGCGGNRSKTRRYEMGEASGKYADLSIITEDNSRLEDVNDIINDILIGMNKTDGEYVIIPNRKEAIKYAIENAKEGDIILLLGKGHENYMDKNGQITPFDERDVIKEIIEETGFIDE